MIFAVFGAPIAFGDDSQRAVTAALAFRDLPLSHPYIQFQNIGISRGLLYSGTVGGEVRHEYTSLGDETNLASRLMSADHEGRILVSKAVYDECYHWFDFAKADVIYPKGRDEAIQTFVPNRIKIQVRRSLRQQPIVGRDSEVTTFHKAVQAVQQGRPRILRLEGEAGIGKSRLAAELMFLAEQAGFVTATGYCLSTGRSEAFLPWRGILRAFLAVDDEPSDEQLVIVVSSWLSTHNPEWVARLPLLGDILGVAIPDNSTTRPLEGSARQQALSSLVIDMLYAAARQQPLAILVEDIHWIDEVSETLINELVAHLQIEAMPILLSMFHRPSDGADAPQALLASLEEIYFHQHLQLSELSEAAVGQLVESRLGALVPAELTHFVNERAQGNPFFVQEVIDALQESKTVTRIGRQIYIESSLESIDMPQTVQGLIQARIDNLSEPEKVVLKLAAIIGRRFEVRILYQSLPIEMSSEAFMSYLRNLELRKFSQLETLYPEPRYIFRHAITQEVTYRTLLYDQRRQWHRSVGLIIEAIQPGSVERLAYHFARSDDEQRAFQYLLRAGEKTAREFANQAALDYWAQALARVRTPTEQFDLHCRRLEVLLRTGEQPAIEREVEQLQVLVAVEPDNLTYRLQSLRYRAEYALERGDVALARQLAEEGLVLLEHVKETELVLNWAFNAVLARVFALQKEQERQRTISERLHWIALKLDEPVKALQVSLNDLQALGQRDGRRALRQLEALYEAILNQEDPVLEANYWRQHAHLLLQQRAFGRAEASLETELRLWRQIGNRRLEGEALNTLGKLRYFEGDYSSASAQFNHAYKIFQQLNDKRREPVTLAYLGMIAFRRMAYGEARAYITGRSPSYWRLATWNPLRWPSTTWAWWTWSRRALVAQRAF
ncbi:MAG: AAA family ATPase [Anaerolineae bacterium]|nr:AAA family ATPase [Anaerolineae bacterium]